MTSATCSSALPGARKRDDLAVLRARDGQACPRGEAQRRGRLVRLDRGGVDRDRGAGSANEKRRGAGRRCGPGAAPPQPSSAVRAALPGTAPSAAWRGRNCGSASAVAAARSSQGVRATSTGASGTAASIWLARRSVAARPAEISTSAVPAGSNSASRSGSAVSTGQQRHAVDRDRPAMAQRIDPLRRGARHGRRTHQPKLGQDRPHGRTASASCGIPRRRGAGSLAPRRRVSPTCDRAARPRSEAAQSLAR